LSRTKRRKREDQRVRLGGLGRARGIEVGWMGYGEREGKGLGRRGSWVQGRLDRILGFSF
jgi:hypothetical protein